MGGSWISGRLRWNLSIPLAEDISNRAVIPPEARRSNGLPIHSVWLEIFDPMAEETSSKKECGGKKKAMLAYGLIQISATVVSAISLAAIALGLCAIKQESKAFNSCVDEVIAEGKTNAAAVRFCNGGAI